MDRREFVELSAMFHQVQWVEQRQSYAFELSGRLSHLGLSGPLDSAQRREAYALLGEIAAIEGMMSISVGQVRDTIVAFDFRNEGRFSGWFSEGDLSDLIAAP